MENIDFSAILTFLDDLSRNNNKPWFDQHRTAYDTARAAFEEYVSYLIDEFRLSDGLQDLKPKDCVSRIYRDLRFSKDKTPYNTHMWATIAPGGKKMTRMGYHVSIQPRGQSILAGGMWEPASDQLARFRQDIAEDASEFKKITTNKAFVDYFGGIGGEKLKTAPQGYDRSHPEIELLKLKDVVVVRYFTDEQVLLKGFPEQVATGCRVMRPFLNYLDSILE